MALALTLVLAGIQLSQASARADDAPYAPGEVLVQYEGEFGERQVELPEGVSVPEAVRSLRQRPDVAYANPNYLVRAADACGRPTDPGSGGVDCWRADQWNFLATAAGIDAPGAWANLRQAGHGGGAGVTVAVLDTGVAYRSRGARFRRDPDLPPTKRFVDPKDFVDGDNVPLDKDGHGTHVTSTIVQATNNGLGLTGLAYRAKVMPVRVLDETEHGTAADVARGIRYAAKHGADVINLSLEFGPGVDICGKIRGVCRALRRATSHGVTIVAAAGNSSRARVAYPAAWRNAIAVGATTDSSCLASYSSYGKRLDLVAPGGGWDAPAATGNPLCGQSTGRKVEQYSLDPAAAAAGNFHSFGLVGRSGTSMAAAHVSGAAALLRARGTPPGSIAGRLQCTATELGIVGRDDFYGAGLLNAARATDPSFSCP
ncbi:MAG: S8 family serine peptidase [Actinomycetota bacterium]|nr:S8 family serine peptidase [Actinomycetota bacterium]